jgi:hypothetical protein
MRAAIIGRARHDVHHPVAAPAVLVRLAAAAPRQANVAAATAVPLTSATVATRGACLEFDGDAVTDAIVGIPPIRRCRVSRSGTGGGPVGATAAPS